MSSDVTYGPTSARSTAIPAPIEQAGGLGEHHVELEAVRRAEAVDDHEHPLAARQAERRADRIEQRLGELVCRGVGPPPHPALAVDADAELDLVRARGRTTGASARDASARAGRPPSSGRRPRPAGRAPPPPAATRLARPLRRRSSRRRSRPPCRDGRARPRCRSPRRRRRAPTRRDPCDRGHLGGHAEVHDVARVVLDDVNDALAAIDRRRSPPRPAGPSGSRRCRPAPPRRACRVRRSPCAAARGPSRRPTARRPGRGARHRRGRRSSARGSSARASGSPARTPRAPRRRSRRGSLTKCRRAPAVVLTGRVGHGAVLLLGRL